MGGDDANEPSGAGRSGGLAFLLGVGCVALGFRFLAAGLTAEGLVLFAGVVAAWADLLASHSRRRQP